MGHTLRVTSQFGRLSLIVNPRAGVGGGRRLTKVRKALDALALDHQVLATEAAGDATRLAAEALGAGGRFLVAVGGDGTVHEVVNGMLDGDGAPIAPDAVLGVVAAGSGCDFVRTFAIPAEPAKAVERLAGDTVRRVDVARISYVDAAGRPAARFFANIAEAGLGAATASRAARMPGFLGQSRYLVAFWAVLPGYRAGQVRVEVDGEVAYEGRAVNVVAANCRYFGGGMQISPRSDAADGQLELLVFHGRKTLSFTMLPKIYRGSHLPHPNVTELRGRRFTVTADDLMAVEADGEVLGSSPVTIEVVPSAITLKV